MEYQKLCLKNSYLEEYILSIPKARIHCFLGRINEAFLHEFTKDIIFNSFFQVLNFKESLNSNQLDNSKIYFNFIYDLYPADVPKMVSIIRETSENCEIFMATHNPLIVNELKPEEVILVDFDNSNNRWKVLPISETKDFEERIKIFALGELWLSYLSTLWDK